MRKILIITFLFFSFKLIFAQSSSEYYFKFNIQDKSEIETLTRIISIDNVRKNVVIAYANQKEFDEFKSLGYKWELLQKNIPKSLTMATTVAQMTNWDRYPTYEVYRRMLKNFETNYPSICKLDSIGTTVQGRKLYTLKISDNVNTDEDEPEFFYTGTIHGDETTGFILLLRLADSLLSSYGTSGQISNLVNNIEIYINPDANPDGTYYGGNNTVSGSRRYNANSADINRDYPDPRIGANSPYQPETQAMMDFAESRHFVMSANFHGGTEVMNYPWDTWTEGYPDYKPHPDSEWFKQICTNYVSTARQIYSNYMTAEYSGGVTNGGDWYVIYGGRQDYMNFRNHCREITIELSNVKLLETENLNNYWNYNKQSLLNFMSECMYGVHGTVKNLNGDPLYAKIIIEGHDVETDNSMVFTGPEIGDYHRPIEAGTYNVIASSAEYITDTIKNITVNDLNTTIVDFVLEKEPISSETEPKFISDTLNKGDIKDYKIILKNTGSETLNYTLSIDYTTKSNSWASINKNTGTVELNLSDTITLNINTQELVSGDYVCSLLITENDKTQYSVPVNIHVKQVQAVQNTEEIFSDFNVYPNPFSNQIELEFISKKYNQLNITLYNVIGNKILQKKIHCSLNIKNRINLNEYYRIESLQNGLYFIEISAGKSRLIKKILKQ